MKHLHQKAFIQAFYIRKCKPTLNSQEECSEFADLLFQQFISQTIAQYFQRSFVCRWSITGALCSIHSLFIQLSYIVTSFTHFTLHFVCICMVRLEYFLIPDDAIDSEKCGFQILLFKQQFKVSLELFYNFNYAAEGQHEQII